MATLDQGRRSISFAISCHACRRFRSLFGAVTKTLRSWPKPNSSWISGLSKPVLSWHCTTPSTTTIDNHISYFLVSGRVSFRTNYFIRYNPKSFSSNFGSTNCAPTVRSIIHNILTRVRTSIFIGVSKVIFNSTKSPLKKLCGLRVANLIPVFEMSSMSISSVSSFPLTKYLPVSWTFLR